MERQWVSFKMFSKCNMKRIKNTVGLRVPQSVSFRMGGITNKYLEGEGVWSEKVWQPILHKWDRDGVEPNQSS